MACKPAAHTRSLSQVIPGSAVRVGGLQAAGASLSLSLSLCNMVCVRCGSTLVLILGPPAGTSLPESG